MSPWEGDDLTGERVSRGPRTGAEWGWHGGERVEGCGGGERLSGMFGDAMGGAGDRLSK